MKILITNVHSRKNLGDDAIMHETLKGLSTKYPKAEIVISANDPESWQDYQSEWIKISPSLCTWFGDCKIGQWHNTVIRTPIYLFLLGVAVVLYRFFRIQLKFGSDPKRQLLSAYYSSDLVLSCGGGNFYAHHAISPAFFFAMITLLFAICLKKKIIMLPQSVGPIEGKIQRGLARIVLKRIDTIMVREKRSKLFIENQLNIDQAALHLPDLAFGVSTEKTDTPQIPTGEKTLKVGITLINRSAQEKTFSRQPEYEEAIRKVLEYLNSNHQLHVFLFSQVTGPSEDQNDLKITEGFYNQIKDDIRTTLMPVYKSCLEVKSAYQHMDIMIGTRMHTGIFALSGIVPLLLIGYQPKSCGMMSSFGLDDYCTPIDSVSSEWLIAGVTNILDHRDKITKQIEQHMIKVRGELNTWIELI